MINVNYNSVKQRKFSFKKGKVSFVEKPVLTADWGVQANSILLGKLVENTNLGMLDATPLKLVYIDFIIVLILNIMHLFYIHI